MRDWKSYQQTVEKAAPATINQRLVALTRFFAWAIKQGLVRENPAADAGSLHLPVREAKGLPDRDLRRLLRAVHASDNPRDIAIVEVLVGTGLRVGELLALQVGDAGDRRAVREADGAERQTRRVSCRAARRARYGQR